MRTRRASSVGLIVQLFLLYCLPHFVVGVDILFFFGVSTHSHKEVALPLIKKLDNHGHNVTIFSIIPNTQSVEKELSKTKVNQISPPGLWDEIGDKIDFLNVRLTEGVQGTDKLWSTFMDMGIKLCEVMMRRPDVLKWIKSSHYDVIVIDSFFNDCALGLVHYYNSSYIQLATSSSPPWFPESFGYFDESYPEVSYHYPSKMTFLQRVSNAMRSLYWHMTRRYYMLPFMESYINGGLQMVDPVSLVSVENRVDLVLVNSHFAHEFPRALPPLVIPVGGMHCFDAKSDFSKKILSGVDASKNFIYVSFHDFLHSEKLSDYVHRAFLPAFMKHKDINFVLEWPQTISKRMELPDNVKLISGVTTVDVLAQPNIAGFITFGSSYETQEAMYYSVPMIVIPIIEEQDFNAERISFLQQGIRIDISDLTSESLELAIYEIIRDPIYLTNSKEVSKLFKDRPMSPLDTAVWWIEYVIRNGDSSHLRPSAIVQNWFARRLLDVWTFLLFSFILVCTALILIIQRTCVPISARNRILVLYERMKLKKHE